MLAYLMIGVLAVLVFITMTESLDSYHGRRTR